jgi:hypothetical protein
MVVDAEGKELVEAILVHYAEKSKTESTGSKTCPPYILLVNIRVI